MEKKNNIRIPLWYLYIHCQVFFEKFYDFYSDKETNYD